MIPPSSSSRSSLLLSSPSPFSPLSPTEGYTAVYAMPSELQPSPNTLPTPFSPYEELDKSTTGSRAGTLEHGYHTLEPTGEVKVPLPSAGGPNTHHLSQNGMEMPPELIYHIPMEVCNSTLYVYFDCIHLCLHSIPTAPISRWMGYICSHTGEISRL